MNAAQIVGMAEVKVCWSVDGTLLALGLGSCIGICAYDFKVGVAGLAHVVLPDSGGNKEARGKFADTAIPLLLEEMGRWGAHPSQIQVALVGGAQLFMGSGTDARLDIGPRNAAAVLVALERHGLRIVACDLGGVLGRTVTLFGDGRVLVKTIGQGEKLLAALGGRRVCRAEAI